MDDLIKALKIFRKYSNETYPTTCEHEELYVCINPELISTEDIYKLEKLGFIIADSEECFCSFRFGSC